MCGHASHSNTPYRQLNPLNKEGVPIIEKVPLYRWFNCARHIYLSSSQAEMLDPEDRAWV